MIGQTIAEYQGAWRGRDRNRLHSGYGLVEMSFALSDQFYAPIGVARVHYLLGVPYEQQGEKERTVRGYATFSLLGEDADVRSPELENVKLRVASLQKHP